MKITTTKKSLELALKRAQGVADRKGTNPMLGNVFLGAEGGLLTVAATDLYVSIRFAIECEVSEAGSVAIPARETFERIKHMPDGPIEITATNCKVQIKARGSKRRFTLNGITGTDFPSLPEKPDDAAEFSVPAATLLGLIRLTSFSISTDETRAHMNSALLDVDGQRVRMVSTDGHRLSKADVDVEGVDVKLSSIVPLKAIQELRKLLEESSDAAIKLASAGSNMFASVGGVHMTFRLVDAQFPPWEAVVPSDKRAPIVVDRLALLDSIRAVALASSDRTGGIRMTVKPGAIAITGESPEGGDGFDEVGCDYDGPKLSAGFNSKYVAETLSAIDDDEVLIEIAGELDPAVIRPRNQEDGNDYVSVTMPMRLA